MPPVGCLCRARIPERWLRIHSLPSSKRYPDTLSEYREILKRQNSAAEYLLGDGGDCILFNVRFGESKRWSDYSDAPTRYAREFSWLDKLSQEHVGSFDMDDQVCQVFGSHQRWKAGDFDQLILMCARGIAEPCLFASTVTASAYAPYDGGADLFFPAPGDVNEARDVFREWLPTTPTGL
jgi:hypothetical protein